MAEKPSRIVQLDLLRAVAILLVLGRHFVIPVDEAGIFSPFAKVWERFGWTGVDLFFVLSGFLIGGLLYEELHTTSDLRLGRFLIRRGFKIWPSYYVFVLFLLASSYWLAPLYPNEHGSFLEKIRALGPHLVHLQNYFGPVWLHTWSLAVEEHFYVVFPLLLLLYTRLRRDPGPPSARVVGLFTVVVIAGCTFLRVHSDPHAPLILTKVLAPTQLRIDGLLGGTSLAYVYHVKPLWFARLRPLRYALFLVGILAITPMLLLPIDSNPFVCTWGFSLLYVGYGCIIVSVMSISPDSRALRFVSGLAVTRLLLVIGLSSYSIYLWHWNLARMPILKFAAKHPMSANASCNWLFYTGLYVFAAVVVGYATGRLIEFPALRLRDRLFPRVSRRRKRPTVAAQGAEGGFQVTRE